MSRIQHQGRLFEECWRRIAKQAERNSSALNRASISKLPIPCQHIYWLWYFQAEASHGGYQVFLLNRFGTFAPEVARALTAVRATALLHLLRAAIPLARDAHAEFTLLKNQTWFKRFKPHPKYKTLQAIDHKVYPLITDHFTGLVATYIRRNAATLFEMPSKTML